MIYFQITDGAHAGTVRPWFGFFGKGSYERTLEALRYMGWNEAASLVEKAMTKTVQAKTVTYDLHRQMDGATKLSCSAYGEAIVANM